MKQFYTKKPKCLKEYRRNLLFEKVMIVGVRLLILVGFVLLWELLVYKGVLSEFLISKPTKIFDLFLVYCRSGELFRHIGISVYETILGLVIGTVAGLLLAIILYLLPKVYKILDPFLVVINALPKTALAPILIIWIGTGVKGIVAVSVSLSLVVTILQAYSYFVGVDNEKVRMLKTFNASRFQQLTRLVLPSNLANIISIIKINIGLAWVGVIVGEFLVSRGGIGYLVVYGGQVFKLDLVMMGVIILAIIAFLMYEVLNLLEKYLKREKKHHQKGKK